MKTLRSVCHGAIIVAGVAGSWWGGDDSNMVKCEASPFEHCLLSAMPTEGFTAVYPGGQTRCLSVDSPRYAFNVIAGDADKLLLYFEGDGLCFDAFEGLLKTCPQSLDEHPMDPSAGVFSRASTNPFRSHTIVYINYCSGDLFVGNSKQDFGEQRGLVNAEAAVDWAKANMGNHLQSFVVMGQSVGGAAVQLWSRNLLSKFSYDRATVVVDSVITWMFPTKAQRSLSKAFGICKSGLLVGDDKHDCDSNTLTIDNIFASVIDDYPDVLFAIVNSKQDNKQIWMYNFLAPMLDFSPSSIDSLHYYKLVNAYIAKLDQKPNFVSYIVASDIHGWTSKKWMTTTDTTGSTGAGLHGDVTLSAWLTGVAAHSVKSQCSGRALSPSQWSSMSSNDYCDTKADAKIFGTHSDESTSIERPTAGARAAHWRLAKQQGNSCGIGIGQSCPISGMAKGEVTVVYPGGETRCLNSNSPLYSFNVIPGASDKLLLYFEGGGLCFNGFSQFLHTCTQSSDEDPMIASDGVMSRDAANPFRDYTVVYLNYCGGDMYLGRKTSGSDSAQRGLLNAEATVTWAQANLAPHLTSFVVIGESAGGAAVQLWARKLLQTFSYGHASVILDSMVTATFPPHAQRLLAKKFDVCDSGLLQEKDKEKCVDNRFSLDSLFSSVLDDYPSVLFALISSKADIAQIWMYNFMAPMIGANPLSIDDNQYLKMVNKYVGRLDEKPNFVSYLISSDVHCWTSKPWMATTDTSGEKGAGLHGDLTLSAWLSNFSVPGAVPVRSQCHGTPLPVAKWPGMGTDYCDESQVRQIAMQTINVGPVLRMMSPAGGQSGAGTIAGRPVWMVVGLTGLLAAAGLAACVLTGIAMRIFRGMSQEDEDELDSGESDEEMGSLVSEYEYE